MRRALYLVPLLAIALPLLLPATAGASTSDELEFLDAVNRARAEAGVEPLRSSPDLVEVARQHSKEMADRSELYHDPSLGDRVEGWQSVGENLGRGSSVSYVHRRMLESESHLTNITSRRFSEVGMGVVWSGSVLYVTQVFREPSDPRAAETSEPSSESPATHPSPSGETPATADVEPASVRVESAPVTTEPAPPTTAAAAAPASPEQALGERLSVPGSRRGLGFTERPADGAAPVLTVVAAALIATLLKAHAHTARTAPPGHLGRPGRSAGV